MHHFPQESHKSNLLLHLGSCIYHMFPFKMSGYMLFLLLGFDKDFDHTETSETHKDLSRSPYQ
jgi:hypothetical protein